MLRLEKTLRRHPVQEGHQIIVIAIDIEQTKRVWMLTELTPGPDFKQLFHRSDTAGHGDEPLGELHHHRLARMHGFNDVQFGQLEMRHFLDRHKFRDHTDNFATRIHGCVRHLAHQADAAATIDQRHIALSQTLSDGNRRVGESRI